MSNLSLVAIKAHRYAGKQRGPGDSYEARTAQDARLMKALKWAIDAQLVAPAIPVLPVVAVIAPLTDTAAPALAKRGRKPRAAAVGTAEGVLALNAPETALATDTVEPTGDAGSEMHRSESPASTEASDSADADGNE